MKKKKLLFISLPITLLSVAGVITGTAAWFTASNIKAISNQSIAAINPETGNTMSLEAGQGTAIDTTATHTIIVSSLRDGSIDVENDNVYRANIDEEEQKAIGFEAVPDDDYSAGVVGSTTIYYAAYFTAKFHLADETTYLNTLHFVSQGSSCTFDSYNPGASTHEIRKALRVGMKSEKGEWFVWAPYIASDSAEAVTYVNGEASTEAQMSSHTISLTDGVNLIKTSAAINGANEENNTIYSQYANNVEYLGPVPSKSSGTQDTLDVRIYIWFEGTDDDCDNNAYGLDLTFRANLQFKSYTVGA